MDGLNAAVGAVTFDGAKAGQFASSDPDATLARTIDGSLAFIIGTT